MALLRCEFFAETLELSTSMTVILPEPAAGRIGVDGSADPGLYLLHGLSDDDSIWTRWTSIERYASTLGMAVVMPAVQRSFYTDEAFGLRYYSFVADELPEVVARLFRVSTQRRDTFVAGLSMGGYGALKLALRQPDRFAAAASLSGAVDISRLSTARADRQDAQLWHRLFGGSDAHSGTAVVPHTDDLFSLVDAADTTSLPALWIGCGTADRLYDDNIRLVDRLHDKGVRPATSWVEGADHTWSLWDDEIRAVLDWLPLDRRTAPSNA